MFNRSSRSKERTTGLPSLIHQENRITSLVDLADDRYQLKDSTIAYVKKEEAKIRLPARLILAFSASSNAVAAALVTSSLFVQNETLQVVAIAIGLVPLVIGCFTLKKGKEKLNQANNRIKKNLASFREYAERLQITGNTHMDEAINVQLDVESRYDQFK